MTSNLKGEIASRKFDLRCLEKGLGVSIPVVDLRYDRIVDDNGKLLRVQVKYCDREARNAQGSFFLDLCGWRNGKETSRGYQESEIEALVVYLPSTDKLYWLPITLIQGKASITLRVTQPLKRFEKMLFASEYEF